MVDQQPHVLAKDRSKPVRLFNFVERLVGYYFLGVLVVFLGLFIGIEITARLTVNHSFVGIVDITDQVVLLLTYLSLSMVQEERNHIAVDLLTNRLESRRAGPVLDCLVLFLSAIVIGFLFLELGWYWIQSIQKNSVTMTIFWPKWPFILSMPIGMLMLLIRLSIQFKDSFTRVIHRQAFTAPDKPNKEPH